MPEASEFEELIGAITKNMEGGAGEEAQAAARRAEEAVAEKNAEKLTNAMNDLTKEIATETTGDALEDLTKAAERYGTAGEQLIREAKAAEESSAKLSATIEEEAGKGSRPSEPTPPGEKGVGWWGWTKRVGAVFFGGAVGGAAVWGVNMPSADECYVGCINRTTDNIIPVGLDDSIPPNLKQPRCPDGLVNDECKLYCSKSGSGACTEKQRQDGAQYRCGMSLTHPDPIKAAECTADAAQAGVGGVFDFWDDVGLYIMYIAIVIGVLVAIYAFKIYTSAYVSKTSRNIKNRAYASGNSTRGAFY